MEAKILNLTNLWKPNELFLTMCKVKVGSIIEYERNRYKIMDIPLMIEGNPICILDMPIENPIRGNKVKIVKI